ncbi:MAG: flagellar basal body P-ring formation protein FlgA [Opitutaceae bacterium]|nr:flagellar basal body P-ring formation protein FlgA [Opitutaceae bacterium]
MVIWSYLLIGASAPASVESVLAPVDGPYTATPATLDAAPAAETVGSVAEQPTRPLVRVGADEIDLLAALEQALADKFQPTGRLRLIPVSTMPRLGEGAELPAIELVDAPSRLNAGTMLLRFRLVAADGSSSLHILSFRAEVLADVWFTQRRVAAGEQLADLDLVTREVDLLREPKAVPADAAIVTRYEIARAVAETRPITWNDITPRSLVRKGQMVEVVASQGNLRITMKGQAVRSGALGETVTIRNLESKRDFSAEVIDENKVRVHF